MISDLTSVRQQASVVDLNKAPDISVSKSPSEPNIALRFEQMLWAEMLSHAGLEEVLTKNGGEAAAAFSRYVVESIAADIAEKHPLGLSDSATGNIEVGS